MRRSEVKQAFQEFLRLKSIVEAGGLEHEDNVQSRVYLWEQVRILKEQVDARLDVIFVFQSTSFNNGFEAQEFLEGLLDL